MAYQYQEYPRRLYKYGCLPCSVENDEQKAAKLAEGWSLSHDLSVPEPEPAPPVVTEPAPEYDRDREPDAASPRRKKGRTH